MGFLDKVKATVKNADSKAGEFLDETKLKNEMSKETNKMEKLYVEIGKTYYEKYNEKESIPTNELNAKCEAINKCKKNIELIKAEIEQTKADGKKERRDNWDAASDDKKDESE